MSRYGMKVANETVFGVTEPGQAIKLIEKIVEQYFGEFWTQHKPLCPLCNTALEDCVAHMNKPVGECNNPKCNSTIHASDYFGKIKDVISEWKLIENNWESDLLEKSEEKENTDDVIIEKIKEDTSTETGLVLAPENNKTTEEAVTFVW